MLDHETIKNLHTIRLQLTDNMVCSVPGQGDVVQAGGAAEVVEPESSVEGDLWVLAKHRSLGCALRVGKTED